MPASVFELFGDPRTAAVKKHEFHLGTDPQTFTIFFLQRRAGQDRVLIDREGSATSPSPRRGNVFPITACKRCSFFTWSTGCYIPDISRTSSDSVRFAT